MEHIEEAGIHSGDSACSLPPHSLSTDLIEELKRQTILLAHGLSVRGLMNIQFAIQGTDIYVLEVNPRASRTVPFVAKATGLPLAALATRVMLGARIGDLDVSVPPMRHIAVKESVFPFAKFPGVDPLLGPEMKSTGEVMGTGSDFATAYAKAQLGAGNHLPSSGKVFISVKDDDKPHIAPLAAHLTAMGFKLVATRNTAQFLEKRGLMVESIHKVTEGRPHIVDALKSQQIALVMNTTEGEVAIKDSFSIRRTCVSLGIPYVTTLAAAKATVSAIAALRQGELGVETVQVYTSGKRA
jgi:carbamoyl-phosphate synthase large subunit